MKVGDLVRDIFGCEVSCPLTFGRIGIVIGVDKDPDTNGVLVFWAIVDKYEDVPSAHYNHHVEPYTVNTSTVEVINESR